MRKSGIILGNEKNVTKNSSDNSVSVTTENSALGNGSHTPQYDYFNP